MGNSRVTVSRIIVLDRCLSSGRLMTIWELMNEVNSVLKANMEPLVNNKGTLINDIHYIENRWKTVVEQPRVGNIVYYTYQDPSFSIFRSQLTTEELRNLLHALDYLENLRGYPMENWIDDIRAKIYVTAYANKKKIPAVSFESNPGYADFLPHFSQLYEFVINSTAIELTYKKFSSEEARTYVVHPYQMKQYENRWYLVASVDHHPESISCFGLERIIDYKASDVPFRENTRDLDEYFGLMVGLTIPEGAVPQDVEIWVKDSEYPYLKTKPIHQSQKLVREENGGKVISLHLYINTELVMRLCSYNMGLKVLAPTDLRQIMRERAEAIAKYYEQ